MTLPAEGGILNFFDIYHHIVPIYHFEIFLFWATENIFQKYFSGPKIEFN